MDDFGLIIDLDCFNFLLLCFCFPLEKQSIGTGYHKLQSNVDSACDDSSHINWFPQKHDLKLDFLPDLNY